MGAIQSEGRYNPIDGIQCQIVNWKRTSMKTPFAFLLLAAAGLFAATDDPTLTGKWQVQRSAAGNESRQDCTFTQKDNDLTGTCNSDRGTVGITGKIAGKNVNWSYKSDSQGGLVTVNHKGTIESPDKITGTLTVVEY
jgi:hypothetical protein